MINWKLTLHKLFFMHEWEDKTKYEDTTWIYENTGLTNKTRKPIIVLGCKTCGTLKRKKIKL